MKLVLFSIALAMSSLMTEGVMLDSYGSSPTFHVHDNLPSYLVQQQENSRPGSHFFGQTDKKSKSKTESKKSEAVDTNGECLECSAKKEEPKKEPEAVAAVVKADAVLKDACTDGGCQS